MLCPLKRWRILHIPQKNLLKNIICVGTGFDKRVRKPVDHIGISSDNFLIYGFCLLCLWFFHSVYCIHFLYSFFSAH